MSDWREVRLGDICDIYDGPHATPPKTESGQIFLGISSLDFDGRINSSHFEYVSEEIFKKWTRRIEPKHQDIVFSYETKLGVAAMIPVGFKCCLGRRMGLLRPRDGIEPRFLIYAYLAPDFQKVIHERTYHGSTVDRIPLKEMSDFPVSIPDLTEQKAIASVLSSLDDKIDLLHRQNKTLETMAETLFRQWFVEEAEEDWEEVTIGDFVELNRVSIDKYYPHKTIEYLDTGSLIEGKIGNFQSFSLYEAPSRAKRLAQHNDILISTVRPDQKHYGIIKNPIENLVVSTGFCVLTCTKIDPHFIYLLLTNGEMTDYLHTIAEGSTSTYPSLKPSDIGAIVFQLPPDDKLKKFAAIAHNSWEKIENNHIQIRILEKLRDTLLPKLMSGEIRVA